jgi:hypothetical protein
VVVGTPAASGQRKSERGTHVGAMGTPQRRDCDVCVSVGVGLLPGCTFTDSSI